MTSQRPIPCPAGLFIIAMAAWLLAGCHGRNEASTPAGGASAGTEAGAGDAKGLVIDGERFSTRRVVDHAQGDLVVGVFVAPQSWRDTSEVVWSYGQTSNPVALSMSAENPANEEAVYAYPAVEAFCLRPDAGIYRQGQNVGGLIYMRQQMAPLAALETFVRQARGGFSGLKIIGGEDLPDLPAALSRQISANNDAMLAAIDRQLAASRSAGTGGGSSGDGSERSAAEKFDDYIRGVDTVDDPYYGTSQHASDQQYHWTDGYGSYRNSNDASYDPNQTENGDWRLMAPSR